jgi:hypothetical protein
MTAQLRLSDKLLAWAGVALLLVLHLDFWRPRRPLLYFGWLPEELAYRLLWMIAASAYLFFFTARIWRDEEPGGPPPTSTAKPQ